MRQVPALLLASLLACAVHAQEKPEQPNTTAPTSQATTPDVELGKLEVQFQQALDENKKQIETLRNQIAQLRRTAAGATTTEQLDQLRERIDLLEELNEQRQRSSRQLDQIRFETGKNILNVLIERSGSLQVTSGLGTALSGFQSTLNPSTDDTFRSSVTTLATKVEKGNSVVLDSLNRSGLLSNPYVSLAVTIGSVFFTKGDGSDKVKQMRDVVCVAEFSARTAADAQFVDNSIKGLDSKVRAFHNASRRRFQTYVESVDYNKDWEAYQKQKDATGEDPVTQLTASFFSNLPTNLSPEDPIPPGLSRLRYQVENVKLYVAEYEALLRSIDDFYASFAEIIRKDIAAVPVGGSGDHSLCKENPSISRVQNDLTKLLPSVEQNRLDFVKSYMTSIPPESRRVLYRAE